MRNNRVTVLHSAIVTKDNETSFTLKFSNGKELRALLEKKEEGGFELRAEGDSHQMDVGLNREINLWAAEEDTQSSWFRVWSYVAASAKGHGISVSSENFTV